MEAFDKINKLPLNPIIEQATSTLSESQRTMKNLQTTLDSMNKILASQSMRQLPTDMQSTLRELNRSMQASSLAPQPTTRWWRICSALIRCCENCNRC